MGEPSHRKITWVASDWSLLSYFWWIWFVWGNPPVGCGRGSSFNIMAYFPSGWPKEGVWWEAVMKKYYYYQEMAGGKKKKKKEKVIRILKFSNPEAALVTDVWNLPEFVPVTVNFSSSFQWNIWHFFKILGTLWSRMVLAAHVAGWDQRCLGEGRWVWQCWLGAGAAKWVAPAWLVRYELFRLHTH